jgi:hypothetical protein
MRIFTWAIVSVTLSACGSDGGGGGGGGDPIALEDLGAALGAAHCAKAFECCTAAELPQFYANVPFSDVAGCEDYYNKFYNFLIPMFQASVDGAKMTYDGDAARDCVDAIAELSCTVFAANHDIFEGRCASPFTGLVATGMPCAGDNECTTGYCEGEEELATPPTPGVCKTLPTVGQTCDDFDCAAGLECIQHVCSALKADGASCYQPDECQSGGCNGASTGQMGTCGEQMICNGQ